MNDDLIGFSKFLIKNKINHIFLINYFNISELNHANILINQFQYRQLIDSLNSDGNFRFYLTDDVCLYGLKKTILIDFKSGMTAKIFSRPAIKSPDKKQYVPLNKNVESHFWNNTKVVDGLRVLSNEDLFFMIICSNVFNNGVEGKGFDKSDVDTLILLKKEFDSFSYIKNMFEATFYKFVPTLYGLITSNQFNKIFEEYISFDKY